MLSGCRTPAFIANENFYSVTGEKVTLRTYNGSRNGNDEAGMKVILCKGDVTTETSEFLCFESETERRTPKSHLIEFQHVATGWIDLVIQGTARDLVGYGRLDRVTCMSSHSEWKNQQSI